MIHPPGVAHSRYRRGTVLTSNRLNALADDLTSIARQARMVSPGLPAVHHPRMRFLAKVTDEAPSGWTGTLGDSEAFVKEQYVSSVDDNRAITISELSGGLHVVASNPGGSAPPVGSYAYVTRLVAADGSIVFVFDVPVPSVWIGRVTSTAPSGWTGGTLTGARYFVIEQEITTVSSSGELTLADKAGGLHVCATNLEELGIGDNDKGTHAILPVSAANSDPAGTGLSGTPDSGFGTPPSVRYVLVRSMRTADGQIAYVFASHPLTLLEDSYYLSVSGLDSDNCPDSSKWFKGIVSMAIKDHDSPPP